MTDGISRGWRTVSLSFEDLGQDSHGSTIKCKLSGRDTVFVMKVVAENPDPEVNKQVQRAVSFRQAYGLGQHLPTVRCFPLVLHAAYALPSIAKEVP